MQHRTITLKKHTQHDTVDYDTVPPLVNKFRNKAHCSP